MVHSTLGDYWVQVGKGEKEARQCRTPKGIITSKGDN